MTIHQVKNDLKEHIGKEVFIKYNLGRNKQEIYNAIIKEIYNNIFVVELKEQKDRHLSFSYVDVITKTIKIKYE